MKHNAQCLCGAVKLDVELAETDIHACHCSMCRTWSSSPLFAVTAEAVEIDGQENVSIYGSSDWAERGFCRHCGTSLFYRLKDPEQYMVCCGVFEDQSAFKLAGEIFIDENPGGYSFAGDHPRLTGEEFLASMES